jgi:hypothetical protein
VPLGVFLALFFGMGQNKCLELQVNLVDMHNTNTVALVFLRSKVEFTCFFVFRWLVVGLVGVVGVVVLGCLMGRVWVSSLV